MSNIMRLNDSISSRKFFGRSSESSKLIGILKDQQGNTTLISGDRGSGKTTLINRSIDKFISLRSEEKRHRFGGLGILWSWTNINVIKCEVPLLPNNIKTDRIRETVLRLIVQTLVSEYKSKKIHEKLKLPLTYYRKLKEIENLLLYKRVIKKNEARLSLAKNNSITLGGSTEYELDLAYTDVELLLKSFFLRFSSYIDFIIVFDELDKYEDTDSDLKVIIKPHEYIKELKNLFTLTNANFIFTSTENYYQELDEKSKNNILELNNYKFSLFTHKILINHLEPSDFRQYFNYLFQYPENPRLNESLYLQLLYSTMWISNLYPSAAKKLLSDISYNESDGSSYVNLDTLSKDLAPYGNNIAGIEYIITEVYSKFAKTNNEYFNRFLYKSLKQIAQLIYSGRSLKFYDDNYFSLIYTDVRFLTAVQREDFLNTHFSPHSRPMLASSEKGWEYHLLQKDVVFKSTINSAIARIIWYFDAVGLIKASLDSNIKKTIQLTYIDTDLSLNKVLTSYRKSRSSYENLMRDIEKLHKTYTQRIKNTKIDKNHLKTINFIEKNQPWSLMSLARDVHADILKEYDNLRNRISYKILRDIQRVYPSESTRVEDDVLYLELGDKKFKVLVSADNESIKKAISEDKEKIICVNPTTPVDTSLIKNSVRLKYFYFETESLSDYSTVIQEIQAYLEAKMANKTYVRVKAQGKRRKALRQANPTKSDH